MAELIGVPAYQQVAADLREKISSGALPVGAAIPSGAELRRDYNVSSTVVQRAINELRGEGLVQGQPGKAVFVIATPATVAEESASLHELATQVAHLRTVSSGVSEVEHVKSEVEALRKQVAKVEANLIALYGRVGQPYPREDENAGSGRMSSRQARGA